MRPRVQMLCHYGPAVQGLSPYGDALARALRDDGGLELDAVGYRAAYPRWLHPAATAATPSAAGVHWARPGSWRAVASAPGDILHIQHWMPALAVYLAPLAAMARRRGKRVVVTVHNTLPHESLPLMARLDRALLARADVIVVHDTRGRDVLAARLGPGADIRVVPHGCADPAAGAAASVPDTASWLPADRRYVTLFGNLRGYKGVPVLLQAWASIAARHPDVDLVVAGRLWTGAGRFPARLAARLLGTAREADRIAQALADPRLAERVRLLEGFIPDDRLDTLLRASELAVFPYERFASQSGAATRAGALGVPLLVSDVGGLPMLAIDPGWVVPAGDVAALAAALDARLARGVGAAERDAQRRVMAGFAWPRIAALHAQLYRSLLPGSG